MEEMISYETYKEFKAELDGELQKTAEGFVRIGYLLKVARDTNILAESGYKTVTEFAEAEYNLNKTQVSRFISINDRFSEGGYSDHLLPEFKGYGYAKLTIMLQIPAEIAEELSPEYSKTEIQAVKEEIDEEKQTSDIEVAIEGQRKDQADMNTLERTIHQLGEDQPDLYKEVYGYYSRAGISENNIRSILAPSGERSYSVRIMGQGRVMLTLKDKEERVTVTSVRTLEKETYTWEDVAQAWYSIMEQYTDSAEESWEKVYGKQFPGKEEKNKVAPVQQSEKAEQKEETKKKSKVVKAKKPKKPKMTSMEPVPAVEEIQEQLPGQMNIEDYEGVVKENIGEIKEENDGETDGMDKESDDAGLPDRAGESPDAGESAADPGMEGSEIQSDNAFTGAAESGGREADPELTEVKKDQLEESWRKIRIGKRKVAQIIAVYDSLEHMTDESLLAMRDALVEMAAEVERILMLRKAAERNGADEEKAEEEEVRAGEEAAGMEDQDEEGAGEEMAWEDQKQERTGGGDDDEE